MNQQLELLWSNSDLVESSQIQEEESSTSSPMGESNSHSDNHTSQLAPPIEEISAISDQQPLDQNLQDSTANTVESAQSASTLANDDCTASGSIETNGSTDEAALVDIGDTGSEGDRFDQVIAESNDTDHPDRRIKHLELALEQCESYINELKAMLSDQAFLESQLAATEEYSHVQQQAIATLKSQIGDQYSQQSVIETLQQQRDALSVQLEEQRIELEELRAEQGQAIEFIDQLNEQSSRLNTQLQLAQDSTVLETQQKIIAKQNLERLRSENRKKDDLISKLQQNLQKIEEQSQQYQTAIKALQKANKSDSQKNLAIQDLSTTLLKAQNKIAKLDNELSHQNLVQAQLQQASQELEEQAEQAQSRTEKLEQQIAEMQEQILHQAQQAREYETAVQHWKDKTNRHEAAMDEVWPVLLSLRNQSQTLPPKHLDKIEELVKKYFLG